MPSSGSPAATNPPPADGTITVVPKLFGFTLSSEIAEAGPVSFVVTNNDFLPHDFRLTGEGLDEQTARLSPGESERTERLARVIASAEYVWDDRNDAREWLNTMHPALENRTPIQAAMTELGARRVEDLLDQIVYGLPA